MSQRIKVVQLCDSLTAGGAERLILGLAEHINHARFDLHICALSVVGGNALQPAFERLGIPVTIIGSKQAYHPRTLNNLWRYLRQNKVDLIHTHLINGDIIGRLVGRAAGIPIVSTMHNIPFDYDNQKWYRRWLERLTARFVATHLIAVSPMIRERYIAEWRIPPQQMSSILNGVPLEEFNAVAEGVTPDPQQQGPLITNIARLTDQKAQHILLDAASAVIRARPDTRFMFVGRGHLEAKLKEQAQQLGIADQVIFAGVRHDIAAILAQTDIFALSSLWEGLPVTVIEAMAAARPVVVTDVGGVRDLVEHGVHGLVVPANDVAALAQALLQLLDDHGLRARMARAGRAKVQHNFSMSTFANQHEALYTSLYRPH